MASRTTSRRKPAKRAPVRSRPPVRRASAPSLPALEQRHRDVLGLVLVALAVFLALVSWGGFDGGALGDRLIDGLRWAVGGLHVLAPAAFMAAGAWLVLQPQLPAVRPVRTGLVLLTCGVALGLASDTLGIGPGGVRTDELSGAYARGHGGMLGEVLHWAVGSALGTVGTHVVTIFAVLAGLLLLTGASLAGILRATGDSVTTSARYLDDRTQALRARGGRTRIHDELDELEAQPAKVSRPRKPRPAAEPEPFEQWDAGGPDATPAPEPFPSLAEPDAEPEPAVVEPPATPVEADAEPEPAATPDPEPRLAEDEDQPGVDRRQLTEDDLTPQGRLRAHVTDDPSFQWRLPDPSKLKRSSEAASRPDTADQQKTADALVEALNHFGVKCQIVGMVSGPHITRYELRLAPGIKVAKVAQLKDDLAYALAATDIRVLAPIPGKQAVGVEVPNKHRANVNLGDVLSAPPEGWSPLTVSLGKDVAGRAVSADLAKMPHLLVAGTTGAGKSGCVNAMLSSVLLNATPHEVRLVLVDPKQVELNHYESIPHLLTPVITSPRKAATALQNLVREMESRYSLMSLARTRSLPELNKARASRGEQALPYILCIIDELADLMMVAPADVEDSIIRIAQKARAVGIHMVLATQSPRVDVITGMIKANVPSRIAFAVSSQTDSRVILDQNGAETLLGQGDMLFAPVGSSRLQRIQGAWVGEDEILSITEGWRRQGEPEFREELLEEVEEEADAAEAGDPNDADDDPLLEDAIRLVAEMQTASTSMLQRRMRLGYTRAGRLIDMLERRNVISGYEGSKPRQVLIGEGEVPRVLATLADAGKLGGGPRTALEAPVGADDSEPGPEE